jgi:selenocysteine-specific elongation factor
LALADPQEALAALVEADRSLPVEVALARSGAPTITGLGITQLDSIVVSDSHLDQLLNIVSDSLRSYHSEHPLETGMPKETLRAQTGLSSAAFEALLSHHQDVVEDAAIVRSKGYSASFLPEQQEARDQVLDRLEVAGMSPPSIDELHLDADLLRAMVERGDLVRIGDFCLTKTQALGLREKVRSAIELSGPLTVAQIRDLLGTSRKYAVPLCEWLDSTGATRRQGDLRHLGPRP